MSEEHGKLIKKAKLSFDVVKHCKVIVPISEALVNITRTIKPEFCSESSYQFNNIEKKCTTSTTSTTCVMLIINKS